jgi:amino acid adenylation domain-containing protein
MDNIEHFYPLSPLQEGLLYHSLSEPDSASYFNQTIASLRGELDVAAFERAWQRVVDHHPVLRTFFVWEDLPAPVQVVERGVRMPIEHLDWRGLSPDRQRRELDALLQRDLERGCDLSVAPLMRITLVRAEDDRWDFLWSFHHILMDGWSLFLVLRQMFNVYEALQAGREPVMEPSRPYRDFLVWLQRQDQARSEKYWRRALQGFQASTPLVADNRTAAPGREVFQARLEYLTAEVTAKLQDLAKKHRLTLNSILQGAWALLLSTYSGEKDVLFGTVVSGRPADLEGAESMVGLCINTLPTRVRIDAGATVLDWLHQVQAEQAEAREYAYSRLVDVQAWSEIRPPSPLFESILLFENYHKDTPLESMCPSLEIGEVRWLERHNYPLAAIAIPGHRMLLRLIHSSQRLRPETVDRMLHHWRTLLEGIATTPHSKLRDLTVLDAQDRRQLLEEWNAHDGYCPSDHSIHQLFETRVEHSPDAVALVCGEKHLTYRELNRHANGLAHRLLRLGVRTEEKVAVCMEPSAELIIALLGTLKAGGVYVFLEPNDPGARRQQLLDQIRPPVLLTQGALESGLANCGVPLLCVDSAAEGLADESAENPGISTGPDHLAYISFTSGSTGRPKGVCIPHRAVVRLVNNPDFADLSAGHTFLQLAPVSFDASTLEIWGALLNGARLVAAPARVLAADELGEVIRRNGVTTLWLTAGYFHQVIETRPEALRGVEQLLAGGDVLSPPQVRRALQLLEGCRLINGYGPTENTTFTCCHPISSPQDIGETVPIGRPVSGTSVYILDSGLQPVPVGVAGDLYAGGDGLARGYLDHPGLTAESFVPNPFGAAPGSRMYRTGDRARYQPDGTIEFLGRRDFQVKLRGFRIELGLEHPGVSTAVAMVREDKPGDKRLVVYYVPTDTAAPLENNLRDFLSRRLPGYMVPAAIQQMEAFPLTRQGKVDRAALGPPDTGQRTSSGSYHEPMQGLERSIAGIWSDILQVDEIGADDNFFDLGGHSLHLVRVHAKLQPLTEGKLSLLDLFRYPSISALALHIRGGATASEAATGVDEAAAKRREGRARMQHLRRQRREPGT